MPKEFNRTLRICRAIQKEIAGILNSAIQDPRINVLITVSDVEVSRDLSHAKVFLTMLKNKDKEESSDVNNNIQILQGASSYIRVLLGRGMRLRTIPKLTFCYDNSLTEGIRISRLIMNKRARYNGTVHHVNTCDNDN